MTFLHLVRMLILPGFLLGSVDWPSCVSDMERLGRAVKNATYAAEEAGSNHEELADAKEELQNCLDFPEIYDLLEDGCRSPRWDYDSALSSYRSAESSFEGELETVRSRFRSMQTSCGFTLGPYSSTFPGTDDGHRMCKLVLGFREKLSLDATLEVCKKALSEVECLACLAVQKVP